MSLINDALKRARENHQRAQPSPAGTPPPLEPATPLPASTGGSGTRFTLYLLIFCVVVGNLLLFVYASRRQAAKPADLAAAARAVAGEAVSPALMAAAPQPAGAVTEAAPPGSSVPPVAEIPTGASPQPEPPPEPVVAAPAPLVVAAPLRLQSVILSGARSSAMISGKVLFLGDRIQGWRVTAIAEGRVTLVGDGQTNVLTLPE